jgi:UDP-glucose:(heptosyl)LPS alpha-1,3-glucosyltransferase
LWAVKIGLVILHADPARGGAERYTVDLWGALRERGHEVRLLASTFPDEAVWPHGVLLESRGATRVGRYARFLDSLDRHLGEFHYDVVHAMLPVRTCDVYHPHAGVAAEAMKSGPLKYQARLERAVSRIGNRINFRRRRFAQVERELLSRPDPPTVLCLSNYVKGMIRKHYDLPGARLATLFNAVDLDRFDPTARPQAGGEVRRTFAIGGDRVVGLMIAQDFARKGLREAIAALAAVPDRRLVLLVVGRQDPAPYRKMAAEAGVSDRVIFAGPTDDPYSFYRAADFLVLPTRHDPCSLVVLESLAMGVPVISTIFNGACEIMADGTHGFVLADPADARALAQSMSMMLEPDRRRPMAQACLELRPVLSYDRHIDRLLDIYRGTSATPSP